MCNQAQDKNIIMGLIIGLEELVHDIIFIVIKQNHLQVGIGNYLDVL
jgi:hypothetical protein